MRAHPTAVTVSILTLSLLGAPGCGSGDPCSAMVNWGKTCGAVTAAAEASFRSECQGLMANCSAANQDELTEFFDCLADEKFCTSSTMMTSSCASQLSVGAAMCMVDTSEGCDGDPLDCDWNSSQTECAAVAGCSWSFACAGNVTSCSSQYSQSSCEQQPGCAWDGSDCSGSATPCDQLDSQSDCDNADYCYVDSSCADFADETSCDAVAGCHWL